MKYKIVHEKEGCIGCGACVVACEKFWEMNDDGKSNLKGSKPSGKEQVLEVGDLKSNLEAAQACPVNAIHIYEKGKKLI
jgi:ferredoxin